MAKFPDPTKKYSAEPLDKPIDLPKTDKDDNKDGNSDSTVFSASQSATPDVKPNPGGMQETNPTPELYTPPPVEPTDPNTPPPDAMPNISSSPFRNIIPLLIGIAAFALLAFLGFTFLPKLLGGGGGGGDVTLTYWGLWEPSSVMSTVISDYERDHPNVKIDYTMQSPKGYRTRLQTAISEGTGPDIARIHNTWLPMMRKFLSPVPADVGIDVNDYYPVVAKDFVRGGDLYAVPLEIDGLVLYYNPDILAELGATPPVDWNAFRKLAYDLTKRNPTTGVIERAGAAMGTSNNVDFWSDILGLLILQNSGNPASPSDAAVTDALTFYTIFSTSDKSWDVSQPNSTYAFATGTLGMMLAPSWVAGEIRAINPGLEFATAEAPKLPTTDISWATYWAEAVPVSTLYPKEAWDFLAYLSSPDVLQKLYSTQSQLRPIGEPYPIVSMSSFLQSDPLAAPFVSQGNSYSSWYMSGRTQDDGINDQINKYYEDAINAINDGSTVGSISKTLTEGIPQILAKFPEATQ